MPLRARIYVWSVIAAGAATCGFALLSPPPLTTGLAIYLLLSTAAGFLKVRLPRISGTYSLVFLSSLTGISHFGLAAALFGMIGGTLAQTYFRAERRPTLIQILFNIGNLSVSIAIAKACHDWLMRWGGAAYEPAVMILVTALYFAMNTCLVSGILSLLEGTSLRQVCQTWYLWSFPYYLIGAGLVTIAPDSRPEAWIILLPLAYLIHFYSAVDGVKVPAYPPDLRQLPRPARIFAHTMIAAGAVILGEAFVSWTSSDSLRFLAFLALGLVAATWKVRLPGMTGTVSVGFVVVLLAALQLSFPETAFISAAVGIVQCIWRPQQKPLPIQVLFSAACLVTSSSVAFLVSHLFLAAGMPRVLTLQVGTVTVILYVTNSILVSAVLCLAEGAPLRELWQRCYFWAFPFYLVGGALAGAMLATSNLLGWAASLVILPMVALVYVSYRAHMQSVRPMTPA